MDGDGSANFKDILSRTDENGEAMLGKVIKGIFVSCDVDNKGTVEASKLIEFISPFLHGSPNALLELKQSLDPRNVDPEIDIDTFHIHMNEWTIKVSGSEAEDEHNVTPKDMNIDDKDLSFSQSTPKSSYGQHLLKGYTESMNMSSCSSYSLTEVPTFMGPDRTMLEDRIQELEHQKRKVAEELNNVKGELAHSVDQNEKLQATLDKTLKKLSSEQKLREQLETEKKREDEHDEELSGTKKQVVRLERLLATMEKQNNQLKNELTSMQNENQHLEEKITRLSKKNQETLSEIVVVQTELEMRKQELISAQITNEKLRNENTTLQDVIEQCTCDIDKLKLEKTTLEKFLRESLNKNESLLNKPTRSNSFSEYSPMTKKIFLKNVHGTQTPHKSNIPTLDSPFTKLSKANKVLLEKIRHPISPFADSPMLTSSKSRIGSLGSGDSPTFKGANASTPTLGKSTTTDTKDDPKDQSQQGSKDATPASVCSSGPYGSPPTLYIVDRTRHGENKDVDPRDSSPHDSRGSDSGEELAIKLHFMAANTDTNESLQEELSKANSEEECASERDCTHRVKWLENEKKLINLQCELMQHQSCTFIIDKKNDEVEDLSRENKKYQNNINMLVAEIKDLKTQLSLSLDKEKLLKERYMSLENSFDTSKSYITEVRVKLGEYTDLETKCKDLESKIEALETENSLKYVKIVELTMEIDNLKKGGGGDASKTIEESNEKIALLLKQKDEIAQEKKTLVDRLSTMEEERIGLKMDMDKRLMQIMNLEEANKDLEHEKSGLQLEKENLKIERENLKAEVESLRAKNSTIELSVHTFEDGMQRLELEKENVENELANFKAENEEMKRELDRFKSDAVSSKSSNSTLENEQRDLIVVNLRIKLDILQREKENIEDERQRVADEIVFVMEERDNLVEEIGRLRRQLKDGQRKEEELHATLSKTQENLSEADLARTKLRKEIDSVRKDLDELSNYKFKHEELNYTLKKTAEENDTLKNEINELKKCIEEYEVTYERCKDENQKEANLHKHEKDELNNMIASLKTQLAEYTAIEKKQEEKMQKSVSELEISQKSIEDFQKQIGLLNTDLENLQRINEDVHHKLEKVNSQASTYKDDNVNLEKENEELKKRVQEFEDLSEKCDKMWAVLEKTQKEYDILKVTHEICEQNRKELIQKSAKDLDACEIEMTAIQEEREILTKEKIQLKNEVEKLEHEIRQLNQQLAFFHTEKNESDEVKYKLLKENHELAAKVQKNDQNSTKLENDYKQLCEENIDIRLKMEQSDNTIAMYAGMNEKLRTSNDELNKYLKKKDQTIEGLKGELDELKDDRENLSNQIEMYKDIANALELSKKNLAEKEQFIAELKKENLALKGTKESLNDEIFLLKETCENYKHRIEEIEYDVSNKVSKIKLDEEDIKEKEKCITKIKKELSVKSKDFDELKSKFDGKNEELVKKRDLVSSLQKKIEAGQKELQEATRKLQEETSKHQYMSEKFTDLENALLDEKNRNNQAKELLAVLESEVEKLRSEESIKTSTIKLLEEKNSSLDNENKTLKSAFTDSNQELLNLVEEKSRLTSQINRLTEETEDLRETCAKYSKATEKKTKIMEESQKNLSDAFQKMLSAEKKLTESDDDLSQYFKTEIDKYKCENELFKAEIAALLVEKQNIAGRLKSIETENQTTKNELEGLLSEKETWLTERVESRKKDSLADFCDRCKSSSDTRLTPRLSNFDKLNIRKEKLEEKVSDLEEKLIQEKESLAEVLSQKIELEEVIKNLNQDNDRLQAEISNLERNLDSYKKQENLSPKSSNPKIPIAEAVDGASGDLLKEKEIQELMIKLDASRIDLITVQEKLKSEEKLRRTLSEQMKLLKDSIANKRFRLERFSLTVMTAWNIPESLSRKLFPTEKICKHSIEVLEPMEKEISRLRDQVDMTSNILDYMTKQKNKVSYQETGSQTDLAIRPDQEQEPALEQQQEQQRRRQRSPKFTLRPPTLIVANRDTTDEFTRINTIRFTSSGDAGRFPGFGQLQLGDTQIREVDLDEDGNSSVEDDCSFDQEASPTLSENVLEDMGLLGEDVSLQAMSDGELEQKFNQVVLAFTIDSVSAKTRFSNQSLQLSAKETQLATQVMTCRKALERLLAGEPFEMASAHLETVLRRCVRVSMSAVQFGSLKHEVQMANCVGLMINYAAMLQRRLDDIRDRRQSMEPPEESSRQLQIFQVTTPKPVTRTVSTQSIGLQMGTNLEQDITPRPTNRVEKWTYTTLIFWLGFMMICVLAFFIIFDTDGEFVFITLPWTWTSFDDSLAPFVKKKYIGGPPPT